MLMQQGLAQAKRMVSDITASRRIEQESAEAGLRPAIGVLALADPASALEAAEQVCKANPRLEAGKAARVEVKLAFAIVHILYSRCWADR